MKVNKNSNSAPKISTPAADAGGAPENEVAQATEEVVAQATEGVAQVQETSVADLMMAKISSIEADIKELRALAKVILKERAKSLKTSRKVKPVTGEPSRRASGFQTPTKISDELAEFMGLAKGAEVPRMEVTRFINNYIKTNNLQKAADRRKIEPDATLLKLLGNTSDEEVSYFNYQRYLKAHFLPTV
jgi:chromatin remodeling complex protein RSC6